MVKSISSNNTSTDYYYEDQTSKKNNDLITNTNNNVGEVTLGKDTFEKSSEPTQAEKEQSELQQSCNSLRNYFIEIAKSNGKELDTTSEKTIDNFIGTYNSLYNVKSKLNYNGVHNNSNELNLSEFDPEKRAEKELYDLFGGDDIDTINKASDQLFDYIRTTSDGQQLEHDYEKAIGEENSAKYQGKSEEELEVLSKNVYEKGIALYSKMSGVSQNTEKTLMKMDRSTMYKGAADIEKFRLGKNDSTLSENAQNYLNKLRNKNQDVDIYISNNSNSFSMSNDWTGYEASFSNDLFELMAKNQKHDDIWNKMINNQYDSFDQVIDDLEKSGDSSLANTFKTHISESDGKISKNYKKF